MTEPKVVGRRIGFWQGTDSWMLAIILLVCPLCVILSVRWLLGLSDLHARLDEHFGDTVVGGALALAGLGMGALGARLFRSQRRAFVVVSACPVCGVEKQHDFGDATDKKAWPTPCGRCIAYLRIHPKKLEVREEALSAADPRRTAYKLRSEQYEPVVPRRDDGDRQFEFAMPAMCAVCCAPDSPFVAEIGYAGTVDARGGLTGELLWRSYDNPSNGQITRDDAFERALMHIQTPACEKHSKRFGGYAMKYDGGEARFASYGFYKAFCETQPHRRVGDSRCKLGRMTSKVVLGKRVPDAGLPAWVAWAGVAIVLVVLAVRTSSRATLRLAPCSRSPVWSWPSSVRR